MPELKYIVAEYQDGTKIVFGSAQGSYPISDALAGLIDDARELPPNSVKVPVGGDVQAALNTLKPGQTLALERGGRWAAILQWSVSGAAIQPYGDKTKPLPVIGGINFTAPINGFTATDLVVREPDQKQREHGIEYHQPGGRDLRFVRVDVRGFGANFSIHHPQTRKAPRDQWTKNVTLEGCKSTGARATPETEAYSGQGGYFSNVDGLNIIGCFIDDNGNAANANIFRHGLYIDAETANVHIVRSIFTRNASYGTQVRSAGAILEDNVYFDNGIAAMLNGATGMAIGNAVVLGHGHVDPWKHGAGGFDLHIGKGLIRNNTIIGPLKKLPKGWWQMLPINVSPRKKDKDSPWAWDQPTAPTLEGNEIRSDRAADLTGLIEQAYQTNDHEPIRREMAAAIGRAIRS